MPELSIIVPVYKVEPYLPKCIDSILSQTFTDFELILIDDGSPDRCGEICDKYAAKDDRIVVIHQANKGVSAARNAGLDIAKGEYIGFVDSDDYIGKNYYQILINQAIACKAEIVSCAICICDANGTPKYDTLQTEQVYNSEQMTKELFNTPDKLGGSCCNKVFLRSTVKDIRFQTNMELCEDRFYLLRCYLICNKNIKLRSPSYYVVENPNSATRSMCSKTHFSIIDGSRLMMMITRNGQQRITEAMATNRYLDDCLRHFPLAKKTAMMTGEKYRIKLAKAQLAYFLCVVRCGVKKILPKEQVHRYLSEIVRG